MKSRLMPRWLWWGAIAVLIVAITLTVILFALASAGISNPQPVGRLIVRDDLEQGTGWQLWSDDTRSNGRVWKGAYEVTVPSGETRAFVTAPYRLRAPCTVMIAARQVAGPADADYGLWFGDSPQGGYRVAAVNGNGYITVFQAHGEDTSPIMEWQVFPRIHLQGEMNTLQVDVAEGQARVRVNDEIVIAFAWSSQEDFSVGFYVETFAAGNSTAALDWISIWQVPDHSGK